MEWYKIRFGTTQDNQQFNVQANSKEEAIEKFKQTDYYKWGKNKIFSVSKLNGKRSVFATMTIVSFAELPAQIVKFAKSDTSDKPLGIITNDFDTKKDVIRVLETDSEFRRINNLLIAGADKYFDAEGNLREDISVMEQQLADGTKVNAAKYLASRVADYAGQSNTLLYCVHDVFTPQMGGVARYIAREVALPLVALLPPVSDPTTTYGAYDLVVCEK